MLLFILIGFDSCKKTIERKGERLVQIQRCPATVIGDIVHKSECPPIIDHVIKFICEAQMMVLKQHVLLFCNHNHWLDYQ